MPIKLHDVAIRAGVSAATASRVLSGSPRTVDPDIANRVRAASEDLGYRPNPVAQALRTQSTRTIGIVVPSIANPYFVGLIQSILRVLGRDGRRAVLVDSQNDASIEAAQLDALVGSSLDGLIVVPTSFRRSGAAIQLAHRSRPVVQVDRRAKGAECSFVGIDNRAGVALLVEHLRAGGRKDITYLGADQRSSTGLERLRAFRRLATEYDTELLLPEFSVESGRLAAEQLLARDHLPSAVVCAADVLAVGLVMTLQAAGVDVPRNVSVAGFDGTELTELVSPSITTLRHPLQLIASRAVELLERDQSLAPVSELLEPTLGPMISSSPRLSSRRKNSRGTS